LTIYNHNTSLTSKERYMMKRLKRWAQNNGLLPTAQDAAARRRREAGTHGLKDKRRAAGYAAGAQPDTGADQTTAETRVAKKRDARSQKEAETFDSKKGHGSNKVLSPAAQAAAEQVRQQTAIDRRAEGQAQQAQKALMQPQARHKARGGGGISKTPPPDAAAAGGATDQDNTKGNSSRPSNAA
jgi:hypothetical protein